MCLQTYSISMIKQLSKPYLTGMRPISCAQCFPGKNRTLFGIFPIVMNIGQAFAFPLCESRVLSDVRIMGMIVADFGSGVGAVLIVSRALEVFWT
jgi:hypothetical protein